MSTVTPVSASRARKSRVDRLVSYGTITSRPPYSSGPQISHTEKSKAYEWNMVHTSSAPKPNQSSVVRKRRTTFW
ncbi:hypothetical protein A3Q37_07120 [Streptomyces sp. PTY087I2]|nr:hypothetical protein A3Q37_07120 [Streptomyces sp. PTY087I2]